METLTRKEYWDGVHEAEARACLPPAAAAPARATALGLVKGGIKRLMGPRLCEALGGYDQYLLWNVIYPRWLPPRGASVVEVGSAPGEHLVELRRRFGLEPYGIEYSAAGVAVNRELFAAAGIDPRRVLHADFFSPRLHARYRGAFDMVLSRGFIEHFPDPRAVVDAHLELLRDGGLLVVSIPNLRGLNRGLCALFHREVLALHNLEIMSRERFAALFDPARLEAVLCDYYGTFSFGLFNVKAGSRRRHLLAACQRLQGGLNVAFRLLLGRRGAESRFASPGLIFVGVKRGARP